MEELELERRRLGTQEVDSSWFRETRERAHGGIREAGVENGRSRYGSGCREARRSRLRSGMGGFRELPTADEGAGL